MNARESVCALGFMVLSMPLGSAAAGDTSWSPESARLGLLKPVTALVQEKVGDRKERTLGKVQDFLLDLSRSEVTVTLVTSEQRGELVPVPARSYFYVSRARLAIDVEKAKWKGAPRVSSATPFDSLAPASLAGAFAYFGQPNPVTAAGTHYCSAASLLGTPVVGQQGEPLGQIRDVMLDLPLAQAVYLVIEPPPDAAPAGTLYIVPPVLLQAKHDGALLVLSTSRAHFLAGPHFQKDFWSDLAFPELVVQLRHHYGLEQSAAVERTKPTRTDQEITQAVLVAITQTPKVFNATHLVVTTLHGRVTLAGVVVNEKHRAMLHSAAAKVVGAENVEDRLELFVKAAKL